MTEWVEVRNEWVKGLSDGDVNRLAAEIEQRSHLDENEGDRTERRESLLWLRTRGAEGDEWGIAGAAAQRLGMFGAEGGGDTGP